jgi:hypothetical protein
MADEFGWHQLCAAMDIVEDTEQAIDAYIENDFPSHVGEKYLRIYGILQGLYLQQDALVELIDAIRPTKSIKPRDVLTEELKQVRFVRNAAVGHPAKHGRNAPFSTHAIVQHSMGKDGFSLHSYPPKTGKSFQDISVMKLIEKQRAETTLILTEVIEELREREKSDREQFREVKLAETFHLVGYAFEKINEELYGKSMGALSTWGVDHLRESLAQFEKELQSRGLSVESFASVKYLYRDEIEYPLTELRKFLYGEASETASRKGALVYSDALRSYFDELRQLAQEIDQEYASEPQPIERP